MKETLLFVYNADGGVFNDIAGALHKTFSPDTYECNLCKITYGSVWMKEDWWKFIEGLDFEVDFLHRDEFRKRFPENSDSLPALFFVDGNKVTLLVTADEMNAAESIDDMKKLVVQALLTK